MRTKPSCIASLLAIAITACGGAIGATESTSHGASTSEEFARNGARGQELRCPPPEPAPVCPPAPICPPERPTAPVFRECDHLQPCAETIRHGHPVGEGCPMPLDDNYARCGIATARVETPVECANLGSCILSVRGGLKPGLGCPHDGSALYEECGRWQPPRPRAARRGRRAASR